MADLFDDKGFTSATNNSGGKYALPGSYPKVRIDGVKQIETQDGKAVVIEYSILESNVPECPASNGYSNVMKAKHKSFYSNMRTAFAEITGAEFDAITPDVCRGITAPAQPLAGAMCALTAFNVPTKAGGNFTKLKFRKLAE